MHGMSAMRLQTSEQRRMLLSYLSKIFVVQIQITECICSNISKTIEEEIAWKEVKIGLEDSMSMNLVCS